MAVNLKNVRIFLWVALFLSCVFAAWAWFRPYAWNPDPAARCEVAVVQVTPDQSYFWVAAHLVMDSGMVHDLQKPILLITTSGHRIEPADTTFAGEEGQGTTDIWLKFWLGDKDIEGPLMLQINDGRLSIKANTGTPEISKNSSKTYVSNHW